MKFGVLALAVCLLALSLPAVSLSSCAPQETPAPPPAPYVSPINWKQLVQGENGRFAYYRNGVLQSRFGVDVSEHQGYINWQAAAADGVEFALIRIGNRGATEGLLYRDVYYEANIRDAEEAGVLVGVYFFSQAITEAEAREEARFVLKYLDGRHLDYPVAYDHERVLGPDGRANHLTGDEISRCAEAFFKVIQTAGYDTMLYGNRSDLYRLDNALLDSHDLWLAEYDAPRPTIQRDIVIWQYTSSGNVEGIDTQVDLNIHFLLPKT